MSLPGYDDWLDNYGNPGIYDDDSESYEYDDWYDEDDEPAINDDDDYYPREEIYHDE